MRWDEAGEAKNSSSQRKLVRGCAPQTQIQEQGVVEWQREEEERGDMVKAGGGTAEEGDGGWGSGGGGREG